MHVSDYPVREATLSKIERAGWTQAGMTENEAALGAYPSSEVQPPPPLRVESALNAEFRRDSRGAAGQRPDAT
ncbi:MAG TPA: hypothetical protein VK641_04735, partial [Terriglobales bacterium]|nr:hypothetical protein [Terriglobales bacterium]